MEQTQVSRLHQPFTLFLFLEVMQMSLVIELVSRGVWTHPLDWKNSSQMILSLSFKS